MGGWKISERMEKWEDEKDLVFPHVCLVGGVEKWKSGRVENSFVWLERKMGA